MVIATRHGGRGLAQCFEITLVLRAQKIKIKIAPPL
jgi:hypothetical protein